MTSPQQRMETTKKVEKLIEETPLDQLVHILDRMNVLRTSINPSNEQKNEYLALAQDAAHFIENDSRKVIQQKVEHLKEIRDALPALYGYDDSYDRFWNEQQPQFAQVADELVIQLLGDQFRGFTDKHHVMNAIKYMGSEEFSKQKRWPIYDIILPALGKANESIDTFLQEMFKPTKPFQNAQGIMQANTACELEALLASAEYGSRTDIIVIAPSYVFKAFPDLKGQSYTIPEQKKELVKKRKISTSQMSAPTTLLHALMGNLPHKVQDYFENEWSTYDGTKATSYSSVVNYTLGGLMAGISIVLLGETGQWVQNLSQVSEYAPLGLAGGTMLLASELLRWMYASSLHYVHTGETAFSKYEQPVGSLLGIIPGMIIGQYLKLKKREKTKQAKKNPEPAQKEWLIAFCPITTSKIKYDEKLEDAPHFPDRMCHQYLEDLATKKVSWNAENNLVWGAPQNHHTQGEQFLTEMTGGDTIFSEKLLRKSDSVALYDFFFASPYAKVSALICNPQQRYVLTYTTRGKKYQNLERISEILTETIPFNEKTEKIAQLLKATHLHIVQFSQGKRMNEFQNTHNDYGYFGGEKK